MKKPSGLSLLLSLDQFEKLSGYASGAVKTRLISSRASSDSVSLGSFANLKLIAEKLVKEQASAKTDLNLANAKLKKLAEHTHALEKKLQNAFNENAKTLCDQLIGTLQCLSGQVQDAEKDKVVFENKLAASSVALDNLHEQMKSLSLRLESSEETVRTFELCEKELSELLTEKEAVKKSSNYELKRATCLNEEQAYAMIKNLEETVATNGLAMESLNSKMEKLDLDLKGKEDDLRILDNSGEEIEKEKDNFVSINKELVGKLEKALQEIEILDDFVNLPTLKLVGLERQSVTFSEKVVQLISLFKSCFELLQEERQLVVNHAQQKFDKLQDWSMCATTEKDALQLVNQELKIKIIELQKEQEFAMVQHPEECRLAEDTIRRLESEAETLQSMKNEMEMLIAKLQEDIGTLSENFTSLQQVVVLKISELEIENKSYTEKLQADITKKQDNDLLRKEMDNHYQHIGSLEKQVIQPNDTQEEKDKLVMELRDREKQLKDQKCERLKRSFFKTLQAVAEDGGRITTSTAADGGRITTSTGMMQHQHITIRLQYASLGYTLFARRPSVLIGQVWPRPFPPARGSNMHGSGSSKPGKKVGTGGGKAKEKSGPKEENVGENKAAEVNTDAGSVSRDSFLGNLGLLLDAIQGKKIEKILEALSERVETVETVAEDSTEKKALEERTSKLEGNAKELKADLNNLKKRCRGNQS